MPKHAWSVVCEQVITDRRTNSVSYFNCIEGYVAKELPATLQKIQVGTLWWKESEGERFKMRVRLQSPSGETLVERTTEEIEFGEFDRYRIAITLRDATIEEMGMYEITVEHKADRGWIADASMPIPIKGEETSESDEQDDQGEQATEAEPNDVG